MQAEKMWSDWCGSVDEYAPWSSPATSSTPPCLDVPAWFMCLKTSPQRSTPGPLPYHMANTPSYLASPIRSTCCEPQTSVEAAQRRAAVAGDEAGGVQTGGDVALALHHRQAHEGLDAGQEDVAAGGGVFVVEADAGQAGAGAGCIAGGRCSGGGRGVGHGVSIGIGSSPGLGALDKRARPGPRAAV